MHTYWVTSIVPRGTICSSRFGCNVPFTLFVRDATRFSDSAMTAACRRRPTYSVRHVICVLMFLFHHLPERSDIANVAMHGASTYYYSTGVLLGWATSFWGRRAELRKVQEGVQRGESCARPRASSRPAPLRLRLNRFHSAARGSGGRAPPAPPSSHLETAAILRPLSTLRSSVVERIVSASVGAVLVA